MTLIRIVAKLILVVLILDSATIVAEDVRPVREIPACKQATPGSRFLGTGKLRYLVPKRAKVLRIKDIDYREYRVFPNKRNTSEILTLFWGNGAPYSLCSAAKHEILKRGGAEGIDARCQSPQKPGTVSRSTGFDHDYAYYDSVSVETAKYFDAIIDSMCYQPQRKTK